MLFKLIITNIGGHDNNAVLTISSADNDGIIHIGQNSNTW